MVKEEILTKRQQQFLEFVSKQDYIYKNFYLTGGTALTAFYLCHRLSEDLDFFNEKEEVDLRVLACILSKFKKQIKAVKIEQRSTFGIHNFFFHFPDKETLKVDFSYYPFPKIEKSMKFAKITIDSAYDIAVNKVHTIAIEPRARDYIDIYFLIKEKKYSFKNLLEKAKVKFDWRIDSVQLGAHLLKARDVKDFPKMLKKINHQEWQDFFCKEAEKLGKEIFND